MTGRDPAFLWETEALRTSARPQTVGDAAPLHDWVTLQEAHAATGIPVNTLRKWARRGYVDSHVDDTPHGMRRMLRFDGVVAHAAEIEREIAPIRGEEAAPSPPSADVAASQRLEVEAPQPPAPAPPEPAAPAETEPAPAADEPAAAETEPAPAGTMIVPIDAWNKMLLQLGNLHEAGQQLAEAKERAAKAETEAAFLRERLAELRAEHRRPPSPEPPQPPPGEETSTSRVSAPGSPPRATVEPWWVYVSRRWQTRRRR